LADVEAAVTKIFVELGYVAQFLEPKHYLQKCTYIPLVKCQKNPKLDQVVFIGATFYDLQCF